MKRLNPNKLLVEFRDGITLTYPIIPRKYTLTHCDITGYLYLTIGLYYAYDQINEGRDELLGEWKLLNNEYIFSGKVYVNGDFSPIEAPIRNRVFLRELPLALEAIRFSEKKLFNKYQNLENSPIYIYFKSSYPELDRTTYWGTFLNYN